MAALFNVETKEGTLMLPTDAQERKNIPVYSGFIMYFPAAILEVAKLSKEGNDQHNPGKKLHWDRSKSGDEQDSLARHLIDGVYTITLDDAITEARAVAWRGMAHLQKLCEERDRAQVMAEVIEETHGHILSPVQTAADRARAAAGPRDDIEAEEQMEAAHFDGSDKDEVQPYETQHEFQDRLENSKSKKFATPTFAETKAYIERLNTTAPISDVAHALHTKDGRDT